jgi:hypothetical protein
MNSTIFAFTTSTTSFLTENYLLFTEDYQCPMLAFIIHEDYFISIPYIPRRSFCNVGELILSRL